MIHTEVGFGCGFFLHLSRLVFSDPPGSVVSYLALIWEKFLIIVASNISSIPFYLSSAAAIFISHLLCHLYFSYSS